MKGAEEATVVTRWLELVQKLTVPKSGAVEMRGIAAVFAGLARGGQVWRRILEGWNMTESAIVNEWMEATKLQTLRDDLLVLLGERFPEAVPNEVVKTINEQPSHSASVVSSSRHNQVH